MDSDVEDRIYKWEIQPHPYDSSFDFYVTDDDKQALEAIKDAAERAWDNMCPGDEATVIIQYNKI